MILTGALNGIHVRILGDTCRYIEKQHAQNLIANKKKRFLWLIARRSALTPVQPVPVLIKKNYYFFFHFTCQSAGLLLREMCWGHKNPFDKIDTNREHVRRRELITIKSKNRHRALLMIAWIRRSSVASVRRACAARVSNTIYTAQLSRLLWMHGRDGLICIDIRLSLLRWLSIIHGNERSMSRIHRRGR